MESLENAYENNQSIFDLFKLKKLLYSKYLDLSANMNFQSSNKLNEDFNRNETSQMNFNTKSSKADSGKNKNCVIY